METLTKNQRDAVTIRSPRVACIAGPGSGKTRVLVERVRSILEHAVDGLPQTPPDRIAIITFTVQAGRQLRERLIAAGLPSGTVAKIGYIGTIHGLAFDLIRRYGHEIGLTGSLSVIGEDELRELILKVTEELRSNVGIGEVRAAIEANPILNRPRVLSAADKVAVGVIGRMVKSGMLSYDLMLSCGIRLAKSGTAYAHLLIDEAQDCSDQDWRFVKELDAGSKFVVGDVDQSIYGFRGGSPANMLVFAASSDCETVVLDECFRCSDSVAAAATRLIRRNSIRTEKDVVPVRGVAGEVRAGFYASQEIEVSAVAGEAARRIGSRAILTRTNHLANLVREKLLQHGIKALPKRPDGYHESNTVQELLADLSILQNPTDERVHTLLCRSEGFGKDRASILRAEAVFKQVPLAPMVRIVNINCAAEALECLKRLKASDEKLSLLSKAASEWPEASLFDLYQLLSQERRDDQDGESLYVGTIHSAKGLEWNEVWLPGWSEPLFPGPVRGENLLGDDVADENGRGRSLEEERRLAFVAITRARENVFISGSASWQAPYGGVVTNASPSRFIGEAGLAIG